MQGFFKFMIENPIKNKFSEFVFSISFFGFLCYDKK